MCFFFVWHNKNNETQFQTNIEAHINTLFVACTPVCLPFNIIFSLFESSTIRFINNNRLSLFQCDVCYKTKIGLSAGKRLNKAFVL